MFEADAFSVLAGPVVNIGARPRDRPAWEKGTLGLAAGVLQRVFRLDEDARKAALERARR